MSRQKKTYVGKIGFCDNASLGLVDKYGKPLKGGHYVYIRKMHDNKCDVNVVTSLELSDGNYDFYKLSKVKKGYLYSIPKSDSTFSLWSAINLDNNIKNVKITDIQRIGCKKIKNRHKWFVGKYSK